VGASPFRATRWRKLSCTRRGGFEVRHPSLGPQTGVRDLAQLWIQDREDLVQGPSLTPVGAVQQVCQGGVGWVHDRLGEEFYLRGGGSVPDATPGENPGMAAFPG